MLVVILLLIGSMSFAQNPYSLSGEVLYIQPMGKVDNRLVWSVDSAVRRFYGCRSIILQSIEPTTDLLTPSKKKYDGDKIINKFRTYNKRILIITEKDLSHFGNQYYPEWSIWGYAQIGGITGVISTHLLKEDGSGIRVVTIRLIKDALHELGHNVGLNHCTRDKRCLMNSGGKGLSELDDECIWLCDYCRARIK